MKSPMVQAFAALDAHRSVITKMPLRQRFAEDPDRFRKFSLSASDLLLDYSKNLVDEEAMRLLFSLAENAEVEKHRTAMFSGEAINLTEKRPVLHVALRVDAGGGLSRRRRERRARGACRARRAWRISPTACVGGKLAGAGGRFTDVVNIGIGGSDLGPRMATRALAPFHDGPRLHFVSNVDGAHIRDTLKPLDPARPCSWSRPRPSRPSRR